MNYSAELVLQTCRRWEASEHPVPLWYLKTSVRVSLPLGVGPKHLVSMLAPILAEVWYCLLLFSCSVFTATESGGWERIIHLAEAVCSHLIWTSLLASRTLATNQWGGNSFFEIRQFVVALYQTLGRNICSGFSKYCNPAYSVWPAYFQLLLDHFMELFCFQSFPYPKWLERGLFYFPFYCIYF